MGIIEKVARSADSMSSTRGGILNMVTVRAPERTILLAGVCLSSLARIRNAR